MSIQPTPINGEYVTILSIDGGGIRGVIPAEILIALETQLGQPICEVFDMIVGTSTGGLLAMGLGMGKGPARLAEMYSKHGAKIFHRSAWQKFTSGGGLIDEKFSEDSLVEVIRDFFGEETTLASCKTNVMVTSYDATIPNLYMIKSWKKEHRILSVEHSLWANLSSPNVFRVGGISHK